MLNIIYDASIVTNIFYKNDNRSGIFFAGWNILKKMAQRPDVNLMLYFRSDCCADGILLKETFLPNTPCIQNISSYVFLCKVYRKIHCWYDSVYCHLYLRKAFGLALKILSCILSNVVKVDKEWLQSANAFFSPVYKFPDFIRKYPHIKTYLYLYDAIPFIFPSLNPYGKKFIAEIMQSAKQTDFFFFDSCCSENDFKTFFPSKIGRNTAVVPLAADEMFKSDGDAQNLNSVRQKYHIPANKKYVFSLSTFEPRKNLIRALKNFVIFVEKNKIDDIVWVAAGAAWVSFYKELKKERTLLSNELIFCIGYVDDDDLPALYGNAEWFVYTSQYEGFGLPPLEAMQCGCPVITSNNSSLPEVVDDAGIMIDWDSDEQHIEAYEKYYFNEELRIANRRKGFKRAKNFSWGKTVEEIIKKMEKR